MKTKRAASFTLADLITNERLKMTHFANRRALLQSLMALGAGSACLPALAQASKTDWPNKPTRMVVPFAPGGATDAIARALGEVLGKRVGQTVVIDNKAGAGGILGTDTVAKAAPDGYTLLFSLSTSMLINQFLYSKLPYDPQRDLTLVTQVVDAPVTLVVHPSVPARNMKELLAHVKANKGKLSFGSWGNGSFAHLMGSYMSKSVEADMTHVPYKGEAPMLQDLAGGALPMGFASALAAKPLIDAGRLNVIGVTGRQRIGILPTVPTIQEQGFNEEVYAISGWMAIGAPAGLPKDIVESLYAHLREAAKDPKVVEIIATAGFSPVMSSPQEFRQRYQRDMPVWKSLVETANAKLD
jgi:tripartite-type tricarboxylate transporter receptor subunit TctC